MAFDDRLRRALDTLNDQLLDAYRQDVDEAVASVRAESPVVAPGTLGASRRLVEAVRAIGTGRTLTEIIDTLVSCSACEASRVAVLVAAGDTFRGWRFVGFGPEFADANAIEVRQDTGGVVADAVRSGAAATGDSNAPAFAGLPHGEESFAVPLFMGGQIVAVLYADHGTSDIWTDTLEVLAQHAARCLEAITAVKAARALTERPDLSPTAAPAADDARDEDHAAAQRYARLLVSEIKLYHQPAVMAGIQDGDLALRLGGEMAHARSLYEQRVPLAVRQQTDYFQTELVRTLANGNAELLELRQA